jgi:divalent metal cation (Fe/Co/Zn/Cd) transporter
MDESDQEIMKQIVEVLNEHRKTEWIDIHNIRVIDYAGFYHIDCHLTVPFYININEGHAILDTLTHLFKIHFDDKVEFFIHVDGCIPTQCALCAIQPCGERKEAFVKQIVWTHENLLSNKKHEVHS